jgi:hypothetical protein
MMNDANENENDLIALPFSSLFSSLSSFCCLFGFGGLFFFSFSLFCCCSLFFVFDETERHETDLMRAHSERKISQKEREKKAEEGQQTPKRQNEKTRASRRESVAFLGRKGESNVLSLRLFFESWRYAILLPRFVYSRARYRTTFCRPRRKGGKNFCALLDVN